MRDFLCVFLNIKDSLLISFITRESVKTWCWFSLLYQFYFTHFEYCLCDVFKKYERVDYICAEFALKISMERAVVYICDIYDSYKRECYVKEWESISRLYKSWVTKKNNIFQRILSELRTSELMMESKLIHLLEHRWLKFSIYITKLEVIYSLSSHFFKILK